MTSMHWRDALSFAHGSEACRRSHACSSISKRTWRSFEASGPNSSGRRSLKLRRFLMKAMAQDPEQRIAAPLSFAKHYAASAATFRAGRPISLIPPEVFCSPRSPTNSKCFQTLHTSRGSKSHPAFITSVVLVLVMIAAGLFYGYPQWRKSPAATPNSDPTLPAAQTHQAEKAPASNATKFGNNRVVDSFKSPLSKSNNVVERRSRLEKGNNAVADQVQRLERVKLASPSVARRDVLIETRIEPSRQIRIPDIRLPAAETPKRDALPIAQPRLLHTYRPTSRGVNSWTTQKPED